MRFFERPNRFALTACILTLALLTTACEDDATDPGDELIEGQLTLDASDNALFVYVTLDDVVSEVTVPDASTSTDWDIAFRRFGVKLNGGVAGPGTVEGANLMNNASADSATVVNFTTADADSAWDDVTAADIASATFATDGIVEDVSGPWFTYSPIVGNLVANPGAAWKAELNSGSSGHAVFRVAELNMDGFSPADLTIEFRHQDTGALGALDSVFVDLSGGTTVYVDLASASVVADSGCNWDLSVNPTTFAIELNDACDAGTFPLDASEDFTAVTDASDAPEYGGFLSIISGAFPSTINGGAAAYWYGLQGANRMWPTYNVFLVRKGSTVFKVQILDYYSTTGDAGYPTVRFEQLQ